MLLTLVTCLFIMFISFHIVTDNVVDAAIDSVDHEGSEQDSVTMLKVSELQDMSMRICILHVLIITQVTQKQFLTCCIHVMNKLVKA